MQEMDSQRRPRCGVAKKSTGHPGALASQISNKYVFSIVCPEYCMGHIYALTSGCLRILWCSSVSDSVLSPPGPGLNPCRETKIPQDAQCSQN